MIETRCIAMSVFWQYWISRIVYLLHNFVAKKLLKQQDSRKHDVSDLFGWFCCKNSSNSLQLCLLLSFTKITHQKNFGFAIHKYQKYLISYASYHHILAKQKITHHKNLSNTQISEMSTDSYLSRTPDKFCCMEKFKIERKNQIIF